MDRRRFIHGLSFLAAGSTLPVAANEIADASGELKQSLQSLPQIKLIGVGGAGCRIVGQLCAERCENVSEFLAVDSELPVIAMNPTPRSIFLEKYCFDGNKQLSWDSAESRDLVSDALGQPDIVVVVAGLGGQTGTSVAPMVANIARRAGARVGAVVMSPFPFEGVQRLLRADSGALMTKINAHITLAMSNEAIYDSYSREMTLGEAYAAASNTIRVSIRSTVALLSDPIWWETYSRRRVGAS
jgi:cell division protein FtsZ